MKKYISILLILIMCGGPDEAILTNEEPVTTTVQDTTTTIFQDMTTTTEIITVSVDEEYTQAFSFNLSFFRDCPSTSNKYPNQPFCQVTVICNEINDTVIKTNWEHIGEPSAKLSDDGIGVGVLDTIVFQPRDKNNNNPPKYKNWGGVYVWLHTSDDLWNQYTEDEIGFIRFEITCNHTETTVTKGGGGVAVKEKRCDDTEFWSNIEYEFDYDESSFVLDLKGYKPEDYGIQLLQLILRPLNYEWFFNNEANEIQRVSTADYTLIMDGFDRYNSRIINLPIKENKSSTNIDIFRAGTVGWLYPNETAARRPRDSMDIEATLQVSCTSDAVKDFIKETFVIDKDKLKKYVTKQPYFVENIFEPYDINNFDETTISKDEYDKSIKEFEALKKRNSEIPPPTEVALVLAGKNAKRNSNPNDLLNEWIPSFDGIEGPKARISKTVVGLYGNVKESDLRVLSNVFKALHVIAPGLDISYSSKTSEVTLPIHITDCNDLIESSGNCISFAIGSYIREDYIWVDAKLSGLQRERTLVHELGHALGLGHNTCTKGSVMSYRYSTDPSLIDTYFSHLDLMMLSLLYNPLLSEKGNHTVTKDYGFEHREVTANKVIELFNLSEDKYNKYVVNLRSTCYFAPTGYDFLIEIQKNGND
ncbi:MAG: hypothetical protein ACJ0GW_00490 [Candidatus Actinomarina sp.]